MADWAKLKVVDLKAELKRRDLPQHGLKAELVARLDESDADATPAEGETLAEADEAEPAPPAEDAAAAEEAPTAAESVPEMTAELSESKEIDGSIETSGEHVDAIAEKQPATAEEQPLPAMDASDGETQKRKRSATPSPIAEELAAKRARALPEQEIQQVHDVSTPANEVEVPAVGQSPMDVEQTPPPAPPTSNAAAAQPPPTSSTPPPPPPPAHAPETMASAVNDNNEMDMDMDHDVAPALHPATAALYISNLMRPLRPADVQAHVCELAAPGAGQAADDDVIVQFHLDQIRTHAFVVLASVQAAARVRAQLHDRVWPNESNRKALLVDFVPPEKVPDWIAMEQGSGSGGGRPGRSTARWEVVYNRGPDGVVEARLQQAGGLASRPGPPPPAGPFNQAGATDPVPPTGPRGDRDRDRDRDHDRDRGRDRGRGALGSPRGGRDGHSRLQHTNVALPGSELDHEVQRTRAGPPITFKLVAPALAERRVENMHSFYTTDAQRKFGPDINRYSFEEGDGFVDRGKEVFEGIRPPHRERGGGGGGRGGRGGRGGGKFGGRGGGGGGGGGGGRGDRGRRGGGGDRLRGDRYFPGPSSGGGRRRDDDRDRDRRY